MALGQAFRKIGRGDTETIACADRVAHRVDGQRDAAGLRAWRRRDGIKSRLQRLERFHEGFGIGADTCKFLDGAEHVERREITIRILATRERLCLHAPRATNEVRDKLEQHVRRGAQRHVLDQHVTQWLSGDGKIRRGMNGCDDRVRQRRIVLRKHAQRVAGLIGNPARREINLDMIGDLLGALAIQATARQKMRIDRQRARIATLACGRGIFLGGALVRTDDAAARLLDELLQHPRSVLAAWRAEIQAIFRLFRNGFRIGCAIIAALAAILLRHRGHHAARERLAVGELHARVDRHGGIVPGRIVVVRSRRQRGTIRQRGHTRSVERQSAREKARQPGALLFIEGRVFGDQRNHRRRDRRIHQHVSSMNLCSVSTLWRAVKD